MPQVFADGARVELDTSITAEDVSLNVIQGGELFPVADYAGVGILPQISPENWFKLVIQDDDGFEVVYCYSHSVGSNTFNNLRRGMDGTTARAFSTGAVVGLRPLAKDMGDLVSRAKTNSELLETKADKTGNIEGNAATATKLESARALSISGGVTAAAKNFDGSMPVDLEVTAIDVSKANAGTLPVARGGTGTTTSTGSGNVVLSNSPALGGTPTAPTAATATNTTQIATTAFVQAVNSSDTGSAATAVALKTARTINGVSFNGTANITINAVDATSRVASSEKGVANGVATLDSAGKVPTTQLPSYVDDVLEFANLAGFPATGETGKIYIALDTNKTYRWSGSAYVYITSGAVDSVAGKTGVVSLVKADVGLSNVDNTADSAKPVSTAQQSALNLKANLASPALTGTPTAPTAADGTSTTQIATTAFVQGAVGGFLSKTTTGGTTMLTTAEASNPIIKVSGTLTSNAILEIPVASKRNYSIENATTGAYTLTVKHVGLTPSVLVAQGKRNIVMTNGVGAYDAINDFESISLTGVPTTTTAAVNTNTTQVASTAFVLGQAATAAPAALGTAAVGNSTRFARENHVHAMPTLDALANTAISSVGAGELLRWNGTAWVNATLAEAGIAPVASPALTGTPTAPTAASGTNTTQVATTAFVQSAVSSSNTPFASAAENAAGTVQNKAVDPLGIREAFNATGSAPVYACRAWVNFNGVGTVSIRASGNVSSITDNGQGNYTVNFTTAMQDANYVVASAVKPNTALYTDTNTHLFGAMLGVGAPAQTTTQCKVLGKYGSNTELYDIEVVSLAFFR